MLLLVSVGALAQQSEPVPVFVAELLATYESPEARQGVAVDEEAFYAVDDERITKRRRSDGKVVLEWNGGSVGAGELVHLDSGAVADGRLYAAHSNYPAWPMTSSIEIWDAATLEHTGAHSFGIFRGSLTWVDPHAGRFWGCFANYDKVQPGQAQAYGTTRATQIVEMDESFAVLRSFTLPAGILRRMAPMSNSGGSWGPDGLLYLTGHDRPEIYVVRLPQEGTELRWVATVTAAGIEGQGIAWERSSDERILWGIVRRERRVLRLRIPEIVLSR